MDSDNDRKQGQRSEEQNQFRRRIAKLEGRKIKARQERDRSVWFGLGMFGLVGWSVAIPTVAGVTLGVWIDSRWPSPYSWTLMMLLAGVALGCWNAWYWVRRESTHE